jgi:hypothetical protein
MFSLRQDHGWSLTELEAMLPYELEVYVLLLQEHQRKEQERIAKRHG